MMMNDEKGWKILGAAIVLAMAGSGVAHSVGKDGWSFEAVWTGAVAGMLVWGALIIGIALLCRLIRR